MGDGARALLVDCAGLYDREALYGVGSGEYPDNARRFARAGARGARIRRAPRARARRSSMRTIGRRASRRSICIRSSRRTRCSAACRRSSRSTTSPTRACSNRTGCRASISAWTMLGLDRMEFWGRISFLKGGINVADVDHDRQPQYAEEIQTPEFGSGLDGVLRRRGADLVGILNGIDTSVGTRRRSLCRRPYSVERSGREARRQARAAGALRPAGRRRRPSARPLIGMISRMVDQKGLDLIAGVAGELPRLGATFVVLGTGEPRYQDLWQRARGALSRSRVGAYIGFDESLAHLIEGGADIFLMPSQFEPCGLNQMYSLRYGTVPVVRAVGGLADTVTDYAPGDPRSTGFVFHEYSGEALLAALRRALDLFRDRAAWRALQTAGMRRDNSWDHSAASTSEYMGWRWGSRQCLGG